MRPVDLYHDDLYEKVDLATIRELMLFIKDGHTGLPDFELHEPDEGEVIAYVSGAFLSDVQSVAWVVSQRRKRNSFLVGSGSRRDFWDCIYYGCPESMRADCLLSMEDALDVMERIVDRKKLEPPRHRVRITQALQRLCQHNKAE